MTAYEKYEILRKMNWSREHYATLDFAVSVYGINHTTIDNWLYYFEGMNWDAFWELQKEIA